MTEFERKILIFLGLWLLLSFICIIVVCIAVEKKIRKNEKRLERKDKEFEKEWNKYGRTKK